MFIPNVFAQSFSGRINSYTLVPLPEYIFEDMSELYFNTDYGSSYFSDLRLVRSTINYNIYEIVPTEKSPIYYHYYYANSSSVTTLTHGFGKYRNLGITPYYNYDIFGNSHNSPFFYQTKTASTTVFRITIFSDSDEPENSQTITSLNLSSSAYKPTFLFLYETPPCPETPTCPEIPPNPFAYETPIDKTSIFSYATSSVGLTSHFPFSLLLTIFVPLFFIILIITIIKRYIR